MSNTKLNLEGAPEFIIKDIRLISANDWTNYYGQATAEVTVVMPVGVFNSYKKRNDLGYLYGVVISNEVYRTNSSIDAYCPTVSDRIRASKGLKTITLTYRWKEPPKLKVINGGAL
jgi:hypothetical protein